TLVALVEHEHQPILRRVGGVAPVFLQGSPGPVRRAIVDDDDLLGDGHRTDPFEQGAHRSDLVEDRHQHRQALRDHGQSRSSQRSRSLLKRDKTPRSARGTRESALTWRRGTSVMIACMFGTYDRGHSANRVLQTSLVDGGFTLRELHEPLWEET